MIYFYGYLGVGVMVFAVIYGAHRLTNGKESESLRDRLEASAPNHKKLSYRLLNNVVTPLLATTLAVVSWPVVVYVTVKEMRQGTAGTGIEKEREFSVERQHLQECLTVQEVERREVVTDPLKAVPELPFGHLNAAWQEFLNGHVDGGELWSFSARWQTTWGRKELRSGYVVVRDGAPCAHFLTVWKNILDDTDGEAKQAH